MSIAEGREPVILESDGGRGVSALAAAIRASDLDAAETLAEELGGIEKLERALRKSLANLNMRHRRWARAGEWFASLPTCEAGVEFPICLARNLAVLEAVRPAVYQVLTGSARPETTCQPTRSPGGELTILQRHPDRGDVILTHGGEPGPAAARIMESLSDIQARGASLALCGVGDGYVLSCLANTPPALGLGREQCVHLIEPQPEVLLAAMMIHDWSSPNGPIQSRRFQWWIGADWMNEFYAALEHDPYLPYPERPVALSPTAEQVDGQVRSVIGAIQEGERRLGKRVARLYSRVDAASLAHLFGDHPPRQPRVLLLTTRFSTVLQHSTRDLAKAFEAEGWATRMPIEPSSYHACLRRNLLRHLADFQPDLVVQIDHLRREHGDLFPPQLPFACWIQDDLPNLMRKEAGAAVGPRDFVLTTSQAVYERDFDYPARQCIHMPKATRLPDLDAIARVEAPDVVYVSNASATAQQLATELITRYARQKEVCQLVRSMCDELCTLYSGGGSVYTVDSLKRVLVSHAETTGLRVEAESSFACKMASLLFSTINNALYRQQCVEWAAAACDRIGLSLGLYGAGWADHPGLSRFARGPVAYGGALESLTRSALINLQVVPYMFLHQRWLDGVAAGGFFLTRAHPMDTLASEMAAFIGANLDDRIGTLGQALEALDDQPRMRLEALVARRLEFDDHRGTDPIEVYRQHCREGRAYIYASPPDLGETSFRDESTLAALLGRFAASPNERRLIVERQRAFVAEHFTYAAGLRRALNRIHDVLQSEAAESQAPARTGAERSSRCA